MNRPARKPGQNRSQKRTTPRSASSGKRPANAKKLTPKRATPKPEAVKLPPLEPIKLGFVRGVAPSKWAQRWARAVRNQPLELVPVGLRGVPAARQEVDVLLERVHSGNKPAGTEGDDQSRHAVRLYEEAVALVVASDHELAEFSEVGLEDIALTNLLSHPDHDASWPAASAWQDSSWMPKDASATLELVSTGLGGALLPLPMARHLVNKREHAVIPVTRGGESLLPGSEIWASWSIERDAEDIQHLVGVMRGRTSRSSRTS